MLSLNNARSPIDSLLKRPLRRQVRLGHDSPTRLHNHAVSLELNIRPAQVLRDYRNVRAQTHALFLAVYAILNRHDSNRLDSFYYRKTT